MKITPVDQAVRQVIETRLDVNLCVEAGAGTGKTTVLVARIVEILRRGPTTVDRLAVITFTEKAAAELSARVREGLERALDESDDPAQSDRIRIALRDLNRARIETIHAFASSLLRERPIEAGLDPNFEVLDDLGSDLGFDESYRRWLGEALSRPSPELWRAFNRGFEFRRLREVAQLLHQQRAQLPLCLDECPIHSAPDTLSDLLPAVDELRDLLRECRNLDDKGAIQINAILELFAEYARCADRPEVLERLMLKPIRFSVGGNKNNWNPGASDQQKEICKQLKKDLLAYQDQLRTGALVGILPLVETFVRSYSEARRQAGTAEFDDLLIWTRDLLRDKPEVRHYFQQAFDCVLVDEFQDTDPLQVEIVLYLTAADAEEKDWRKLTPRPGKLFVVGDPKQSIYRFRRADITIYEWVKKHVLSDGQLTITQNFRSVRGVITWVNDVFAEVIQESEGIQPKYSGLDSARADHNIAHAPVVLIRGTGDKADDVRQEEARLLAGLIERVVRDECWPVADADAPRPASWRDVAILLPARTGIEFYEQALADRNIPYRHEGGRSFFDRQEVRELVNCLKAIDDPTDRLSLVAALRSGAFGCSDAELFQFVTARGKLDLRVESDAPVPAVTEALAILRGLHALRGQVTLPEFVGRVLEETRLVEYAMTLPQGQQAAANLMKMADQARAFSGVRGGGLRAFVRWLATSSGARADEADAAVAEARDDVVRILTIHAAKGLEFPIVALANLNRDGRSGGMAAIPDPKERRLDIRIGTQGFYFKTPRFDEAAAREKLHEDAEQRRLLYVAATRARDYLLLPAVLNGDKSTGMLAALSGRVPLSPDATVSTDGTANIYVYDASRISIDPPVIHRPGPVLPGEIDAQEARRSAWLQGREELIGQASRGLSLTVLDELDTWEDDLDGAEELGPRTPEDEAQLLDRALHRVLARVDYTGGNNLASLCRRMAERAQLPDADTLLQLTRTCLGSPVISRAGAAGDAQRGVTFSAHLPNGGFAEGQIDLLFTEAGELVAVDFRADDVTPEQIHARSDAYRRNAAAHAFAVEAATGLHVREVCFVFARTGVEQGFTVDDDLRGLGAAYLARTDAR